MVEKKSMERAVFTIREVSEILGLGINQCYALAHQQVIPCLRLGGRIVVPKAALEKLLAQGIEAEGEVADKQYI